MFILKSKILHTRLKSSPYFFAFLVFIFSSIFFLADIGENSIRYSDEATHVRVIQEMHASQAYFSPTLDSQLYLNKPPLKMWLTLGVIKFLGESNFSFRLIDGLCSAAIVAFTFLFGSSLFSSRLAGLLASFILLGSSGYFYGGRFNTATQDAFVVFTNTWALWCAYLGLTRVSEGKDKSLFFVFLGFGLAIAAGVLTKSVVGLVPLVIILPVLLFKRSLIKELFERHFASIIVGASAAVLPVLIYFGQVFLRFDDAWSRVFGYDIKARLFTEGFHNPEKWWFYLDRLFIKSEFCDAWLLALALLFQVMYVCYKPHLRQIFLTSWAFLPLIIFSSLQSRAFHYIGPAFPAFALVITAVIFFCINSAKAERRKSMRYLYIGFICLCLISVSLSGVAAAKRLLNTKRKLPIEIAVNDLKKITNTLRAAEYDFAGFVSEETYQRWRAQFYLDSFARNRKKVASLEELKLLAKDSQLDVVFTSWTSALELMGDNSLSSKVCGYWPLWRPEKKRQSVSPRSGIPDALAILLSSCEQKNKFESMLNLNGSYKLDSKEVQPVFGIGSKRRVGKTDFWLLSSHTAAFSFRRNDLLNEFPTKITINAAIEAPSSNQKSIEVALVVNGSNVGSFKVAGGKFRESSLELPKGIWSRGDNFITLHDLGARENQAGSSLLISGFEVRVVSPTGMAP